MDEDINSFITYDNKEFEAENDTSIQFTEDNNQTLVSFLPKEEYNYPQALQAKEKEIEHFKVYGVYKEVADSGQPRIMSGWVLTRKHIEGKEAVKARLVCHGN